MDVEIIFSVTNLVLAVAVFYFARKKDTKNESAQTAELVAEMRNVRGDITEIKSSVDAMRSEWRSDHDALIGVIREMKAVWKLLDSLKGGQK